MRLRADIHNGIIRIAAITAMLVAPMVMYWHNPEIDSSRSICPFMRFLDIPCPGCGLTKSMIHAYKLEFGVSMDYHLWGIPLILIGISLIVLQVSDLVKHRHYTDKLLSNVAVWQTVAFAVVLTYAIRLVAYLT